MGYRNHEGYADPTAGQAYANVRREERAKRKAEHQAKVASAKNKKKQQRHHPPRRRGRNDTREVRR